jgi:hypothetical protein
MSRKELVEKHLKHKFESEIGTIEYRLTESIANLELMKSPLTEKLLASLDDALTELTIVQNHIKNGTQPPKPFKLPEGYRDRMEPMLIDRFVEGRDYSGYIREQATYEVEDMTDEQLFEEFEACFYDEDCYEEEMRVISTIQDIKDKEDLEEIIHE